MPNPKLRLREQVGEVMRFKHYSYRTEVPYWQWVRRFILFHGKRHPREMGAPEVRSYLSHLAAPEKVEAAMQIELTGVGTARPHRFWKLGTSRPLPCMQAPSIQLSACPRRLPDWAPNFLDGRKERASVWTVVAWLETGRVLVVGRWRGWL